MVGWRGWGGQKDHIKNKKYSKYSSSLETWLSGPPMTEVSYYSLRMKSETFRVPKRTGGCSDLSRNAVLKIPTISTTPWCTHLLFLFTEIRLIQQVHRTPPMSHTQLFGDGPSAGNGGRRWGGRAPGGKPEAWGICGGALGGGGGIPGIPPGGGGGMASVGGWPPRPVISGGGRLIVAGAACPPGGGISFSILKWNWRKNWRGKTEKAVHIWLTQSKDYTLHFKHDQHYLSMNWNTIRLSGRKQTPPSSYLFCFSVPVSPEATFWFVYLSARDLKHAEKASNYCPT